MELGVGGSNPPCCTKIMSKEKNLKPSKELPLGFVDRQEKELLIRDFVISNIKEVMTKYGFQYLETPSFEYTDSIGKFLPDKERPDQGVFSFKDEKKWLSLRYDLTAPLARYVAKNYLELPKPFTLPRLFILLNFDGTATCAANDPWTFKLLNFGRGALFIYSFTYSFINLLIY